MQSRISFNGREHSSPDEMPAGVRRWCIDVLTQLADKDENGIPPDVLERAAHGTPAGAPPARFPGKRVAPLPSRRARRTRAGLRCLIAVAPRFFAVAGTAGAVARHRQR